MLSAEYAAVHTPGMAGVIDPAPRGVLQLTGTDRAAFLQGMVSNDVLTCPVGQSVRAALLDTTGHVLALVRVHIRPEALLVETDARTLSRLHEILERYLIMEDVVIADVSSQWSVLSVRGVGAGDFVSTLPEGGFTAPALEDAPGFDLWMSAETKHTVLTALISNGAALISEQTAEILRVEAGLPAWGTDLTETTLLPEAELADTVSYTKGCYVGQEIIARLHARGHANRGLRGILLAPGAPVPHAGDTVHLSEHGPDAGREIGRITSAVASPMFDNCALALAYVRREYADNLDMTVTVHISQPYGAVFPFSARILNRPFSPQN